MEISVIVSFFHYFIIEKLCGGDAGKLLGLKKKPENVFHRNSNEFPHISDRQGCRSPEKLGRSNWTNQSPKKSDFRTTKTDFRVVSVGQADNPAGEERVKCKERGARIDRERRRGD